MSAGCDHDSVNQCWKGRVHACDYADGHGPVDGDVSDRGRGCDPVARYHGGGSRPVSSDDVGHDRSPHSCSHGPSGQTGGCSEASESWKGERSNGHDVKGKRVGHAAGCGWNP